MTDADFYEDLAQFMTDSMMESGFIDAEEVATKVRKQDVKSGRIKKLFRLNTEAAKQNERAKTIEDIVAAVEDVQPNNDGEGSYQQRIIAYIRDMDK